MVGFLLAHPNFTSAQTTTYHLHNGDSGDSCCRSMTTSGPTPTGTALQTIDLKNATSGASPWAFQTPSATGLGGTIPSGSVVSFSIWMRKTAAWGVIRPQATLQLNGTTQICSAVGGGEIVQSPSAPLTFQCASLAASNPQATTDKLRLWVGYSFSTLPGNHSVKVELDFDGSTDSRVTVPNPAPPQITSVNPASGPGNWTVTISGTNFRSAQGLSTVKFNGTSATTIRDWSDTSITTDVPTGLTPGAGTVRVTVGGADSNIASFTVIGPPSLTSVTPSTAQVGNPVTISGANFLTPQGSSTLTFTNAVTASPTGWNDTSITTTVPAGAVTGPVTVTVSGQTSSLSFTIALPGTMWGAITRATDSAPVQGATVQAVLAGVIKATATTPADGTYSVGGLDAGTYDLRVLATGYSSEVRSVAVVADTPTNVNVAMSHPGSISGQVTAAGTPLPGAAVTMFLNGIQKGTANTNTSGNYSIAALHPGSYTLQVVDVGYRTKEQGAVIVDGANTTANVSLDPAPSGPVSYAYDALGRLVSVVDASGEAATYTYDPVGNILSIGRIGAGTVAITQVNPNSAAVGTTVTVYGTGFSATPAQNTVTINGTAAVVTSSTATQIVTSVPSGAALGLGQVAVTSPLGWASKSFTVATTTGAPTITGFTPAVASPSAGLTISGTNFETVLSNNRLLLDVAFASVSTASTTSMTSAIPGAATSGKITIATPAGTAVSANDLVIPPSGFTPADVEFTGRMSYGEAASLTVPITSPGKIGLVLFDGAMGHRVSVRVSGSTIATATLKVFAANGTTLSQSTFGTSAGFAEPKFLSADGTCMILVDPGGSFTGSATLTLYDVPEDITNTIVPGGDAVTVGMTVPGQNAVLTFAGTAGQIVSVTGTGNTFSGVQTSILRPDGTTLADGAPFGTFIDATTLPVSGTYKLLVDPGGAATGSMTMRLFINVVDIMGTITPSTSGAIVTPEIALPGQNARYSFTGSQDQRISVTIGAGPLGSVKILLPDGTTALATGSIGIFNTFIDVQTLPEAGTYILVADPLGAGTGSITLTTYDVPADLSGTVTINGSDQLIPISTPGQNGSYTFTAATTQSVRVLVTSNSYASTTLGGCVAVKLMQSTTVLESASSCAATFELNAQSVTPGSYTVVIDPQSNATGSLNVRVVSP